MANLSKRSNYRVQQEYANPEAVRLHSGIATRWVDVSEHQTKAEANRARKPEQRVIKICTPGTGAMLMCKAGGAYPGRRYNLITPAEKKIENSENKA